MPRRGQSGPPGGCWEDATDEHIIEPNLHSPGKSVWGEKAAWVFIIKILPTQWREHVLLLQIRREETACQAGAVSSSSLHPLECLTQGVLELITGQDRD